MRLRHSALLFVLTVVACSNDTTEERTSPALPPPPPPRVQASEQPAALRDDLKSLHEAGVLRALVSQRAADDVPRAGTPAARDWDDLDALATDLGVKLQRVIVPDGNDLTHALAEGKGDIIAEPRFINPQTKLVFGPPLRSVELVVVTGAAATEVPKRDKDLAGQVVTTLAAHVPKKPHWTAKLAPEGFDDLELLSEVGNGHEKLALVRSDALANYQSYADDVQRAFALAGKHNVAWAVRPTSVELQKAIATFVYARELTQHQHETHGGDLDGIMKRKVLRVAMLNNGASYFVYRGQEVGFQYDVAALIASRLGVRLQVIVPSQPSELLQLVTENKADLVPVSLGDGAANDTMTFSHPIASASWMLVQPAGEKPITDEAELAGREVHVRASSAYRPLLDKLAARVPGFKIIDAPEDLETEELIDEVGTKARPLTVSNSLLLEVELTYRDDVQGTLVLATDQPLVYGMRNGAPKLKERMDKLLARERKGAAYKAVYAKYFGDKQKMAELRAAEASTSGTISPYDDIVRKAALEHNVDWRLVLAQMYQESRFNPEARSWVGAVGLMQIMPRTGAELGLKNLRDPEGNVRAGVKYLAKLIGRFDKTIPMRQRVRMALAGYNAGLDHVFDARILAKKKGWDPNRWFGHVEQAMLLLEKPKYYRRARRGFCRGREPVAYVSRIQSKYDAYVALMPGAGPEDE